MTEAIEYYAPCHIVNKIQQNVYGDEEERYVAYKYLTLT
jgi:hypothetical protein